MTPDSLKLTAYFGERKRAEHRFIADALLDLFDRHAVATSILLRGMEGFGLGHHLRTDSSLTLSEDLPAVAIAVDSSVRIDALLAEAAAICTSGLLTLERARLYTARDDPVTAPDNLAEATKLTVYLGRTETVSGTAAYAAVCHLLHRGGVSGASTLLGVDGTVQGRRARARFFGRNADVPVAVVAVGSTADIGGVLPVLNGMLKQPLITFERIQVCKRDGQLLSTPHPLPSTDEHGLALWQRLTVYTSESQCYQGQPIHRGLIRRLRQAGAAGTTTLRGIWGFHGEREPHGDRVWQLGRRVPTVTTVIDSPDRIAAWFEIVDEFTSEHGLVTSDMVPAVRTSAGAHGRGGLRLARHDY
jgi:PII-like signaling protein